MGSYRLLVTFRKEEAENSLAAREHTYDELINNNFTGTEGYWGGGVCDYFDIGNCYCGELNDPLIQKLEGERECDGDYGCEDDAQVVTEEIWERLIKPLQKLDNHKDYPKLENELIDISDWTPITNKEQLVDKRWIVVVRYHV
jgi:hypothetical protein